MICPYSILSVSTVEGFADDYAFLIRGLVDLYEASHDPHWLKWALELQEQQDRLFLDIKGGDGEEKGGYFSTSGMDTSILLRMKDGMSLRNKNVHGVQHFQL